MKRNMTRENSTYLMAKSWLAGVSLVSLAVAVMAMPVAEPSWAQDMPPQPLTVSAPDDVSALTPSAPIDPSTGVPAAPLAAPSTAPGVPAANTGGTQSSSGTYETLDPAAFKNLEDALGSMAVLRKNVIPSEEVGTLVFTLWQHALLADAKKLFRTRRPTDAEIAAAAEGGAVETKPRGIREIGLNGILYKGKDNWVVWLNGKRLAPDALPKEVIDIKVHSTYIDLKWFDAFSNLIYPIRIRPHQRFNLDTRIFLPGLTADAAAELQAVSTGLQ